MQFQDYQPISRPLEESGKTGATGMQAAAGMPRDDQLPFLPNGELVGLGPAQPSSRQA